MTTITAPPLDRILLAVIERDKTIPQVRTGLFLPENLSTSLPFVTVSALPGQSTLTDVTAGLDLNVYAATRGGATGALAVCAMVEKIVVDQPHSAVVDGRRLVIDSVATGTFSEVPWDDQTIRHYLATVQATARRV